MIRNRKQIADYHVRPIPRMRRLVVDQAWLAQRKHMIRGLIEVDVTTARQTIRDHQAATGERRSFTAFLVACLGHAVDANRDLQAYQDWRGRLIVFDDVDVVTIVEIMADGQSFPLAHIVWAANRRTVREIHDEIRAVQVRPAASPSLQHMRAVEAFVRLKDHHMVPILNENRAGFYTRAYSRGLAKMCYHSSCSENDRGGALTSPSLGRLLISHITLQELTPML